MRIGCHLSVGKGFLGAVNEAPKLGASCFQYFTKNPRGFRGVKPLNVEDARLGSERMAELDLVAIGHAPYLINLATQDPELFELSVNALVQDLRIAGARGSYAVVVHCGKPKDAGPAYGIRRMREAIERVLAADPPPGVRLLLENTAGQGSEIGAKLDELMATAEGFDTERLGFCFDTQHAFAAGILSREDPRGFEGFRLPAFMERLGAIHLNDSKVPFGGRKDRHELIGRGELGAEAIRAILTDPRLDDAAFYLETPVDNQNAYADEIRICEELVRKAGSTSP